MALFNPHRILSRPLRLRWAGWEADTYNLQTAGWRLAAEEDVARDQIRIAFSHDRYDVRGFSQAVPFRYLEPADEWDRARPTIPVAHMANRLWVRTIESPFRFRAIDATPQLAPSMLEHRLEDLVHFAPAMAEQRLILPDEASVPELLERIVAMQQGARIERIREELRAEPLEQHTMRAQILTFKRAA